MRAKTEVGETELTQDRSESLKAIVGSLYEKYYERIVRYIFIRINDQNEAENLGGEVFLKALQSLQSYRGQQEQMRAWLFKIAHNLVVDHLRRVSRYKNISFDDAVIPGKLDTEHVVETKLDIDKLSEALKRLTPAQREVIGLRFFAGLSSKEAGKILRKSSGAVREMQRAAIESLRQQIYVQERQR